MSHLFVFPITKMNFMTRLFLLQKRRNSIRPSLRANGPDNFVTPMNAEIDNDNSLRLNNLASLSPQTISVQYPAQSPTPTESNLAGIHDILKDFQERYTSEDEHKALVSEWALVAMVIDRILFILFAIGTIAVSATILLSHPDYKSELPEVPTTCLAANA